MIRKPSAGSSLLCYFDSLRAFKLVRRSVEAESGVIELWEVLECGISGVDRIRSARTNVSGAIIMNEMGFSRDRGIYSQV